MSNFNIWNKYFKENVINIRDYESIYKVKNKESGNYFVIIEVDKIKYISLFNEPFNEQNYLNQFILKNSLTILEKINTKEHLYIITEFYFMNLEDYLKIRQENISIDEIKQILLQLKPYFNLLRENNFVYKNLKLSNIILTNNSIDKIRFKLSDFNLYESYEETRNSKIKNINDTLLTKAPELIKHTSISTKSDIWSLGIIIYYLLFREYPYNGKTEVELFQDIISRKELKITNNNILNDLLYRMIVLDDNKRISWTDYFNHHFFKVKTIIKPILPNFNFICPNHSKIIGAYCKSCKQNICEYCMNNHHPSIHQVIPFYEIGLTNVEVNKIKFYRNEIEHNIKILNKIKNDIDTLFKKMELIKINTSIYDNDYKNNFKSYFIECLNIIKENSKIEGNITGLEILNNYHSFANNTQLKILNLTEIKSIKAHNDSILNMSVFPLSGNSISVSKDNSIKIWDPFFNLIQNISNAHEGWIISINIKDENYFATSSIDKNIKIWKKNNDNQFVINDIIPKAHNNTISKIILGANFIISCSYDGKIKFWKKMMNNQYSCINLLTHSNWINSMILIEDKNLLISSGLDGTKFWDLKTFKCINFIRNAICQYIGNNLYAFDHNDKIMIGGGNDKIIKIYSFSENKIIKEINNDFICWGICHLKERGIFLIVGKSHHLSIYRDDNYELVQNIFELNSEDICGIIELNNSLLALYSLDKLIKLYSY